MVSTGALIRSRLRATTFCSAVTFSADYTGSMQNCGVSHVAPAENRDIKIIAGGDIDLLSA